ncbi:MAG: UDP-N-acetylmuramoyl-L-alanine--D-glutamate ligase [Verrucomicrobiota bacterium]|jgi:UDP-N-acetylmuramoylalanine--D-glutamate ligase
MTLQGQNVVVLGAGRSGRAAAALALREGARVSVYDEADAITGFAEVVSLHPSATAEIGANVQSDLLIVSPGIDTFGPLVEAFSRCAKRVVGEMEFAWHYYPGFTIAITGTNGKTTTTEIISQILNKSGISCVPCGNYGKPLAEVVMECPMPEVISLEASSFQLETIAAFKPHVAVWLNFAPDHMDRYPTLESYHRAKLRIFENQDAGCTAVIRKGESLPALLAKTVTFSSMDEVSDWTSNGITIEHAGEQVLHVEKDTCLRGLHNAENIMAAIAACQVLGRPLDLKAAFADYVPPPHRCELVRTLDGVEYLNDSKATNLHALESALRSQTRPVVLIAGGKEKGLDYRPVLPLLQQKAVAAVTFGQIAAPLGEVMRDAVPTHVVHTLEEAVHTARKLATRGSTVLFSPGTSSFDMFRGYEHRGDMFRQLVHQLA